MVRPSALALAEKCGLSVDLAERFPEQGPWAAAGKAVHAEIEAWVKTKAEPTSPAAQAARDILLAYDGWAIHCEERITLVDPETGDRITEGTPDIIAIGPEAQIVVIDWKSGWAGHVPDPDDNLQLLAYGAAAVVKYGGSTLQVTIAKRLFDPNKRVILHSRLMTPDEIWPIIDRIAAVERNRTSEAQRGLHCGSCFSRARCYAWMLPAHEGEGPLVPFTQPEVELTNDQRVRALMACDAMEDAIELVRARIKADVETGIDVVADGKVYRPITCKGKESASVKELREAGMIQFIRRGADYPRWQWVKDKADK
jgi:hypothetical protein